MKPEEHLQRIRARCVELLALAEKRTPGKWTANYTMFIHPNNGKCEYGPSIAKGHTPDDTAFIAACAGSAEAGWRSTIYVIDMLFCNDLTRGSFALEVISAWPEELL